MLIKLLKSKLHGVEVTDRDLLYEGSIMIDEDLLDMAGMSLYEEVQIWNRTNGERLSTYTIAGKRGSGVIMLNGAAARRVEKGDHLIIAAYAYLSPEEVKDHTPTVVLIDKGNKGKLK